MTSLNNLAVSLQRVYVEKGEYLSDIEANEAADRLLRFFKLLLEIDQRNKKARRFTE